MQQGRYPRESRETGRTLSELGRLEKPSQCSNPSWEVLGASEKYPEKCKNMQKYPEKCKNIQRYPNIYRDILVTTL